MIERNNLIKEYLEFFKSKDHKIIPSASLIPEDSKDTGVLFTTAGMHPLVPYLIWQKHPLGKRLANVQKCIRTTDIEEVGDSYHHTFFEMLGNWSLGDYFKKEAIEMSFEFLTKVLKIPKERLAISVFNGNKDSPKDTESENIWLSLGIPKSRIAFLGKEDNWWGPAGSTGPCGPDTEMFYWKPSNKKPPSKFNPEDKNWVEIWNDVFMEYIKDENGNYNTAKQKNVDTGMGVERTLAVLNNIEDDYLTEVFLPIIKEIEKLSGKKYGSTNSDDIRAMRIISDHVKAAVFILSEGIIPSNTERGYILRRLIRRAVRYGRKIGIEKKDFLVEVSKPVFKIYGDYKELGKEKKKIQEELRKEEEKFELTLQKGLKIFEKRNKVINPQPLRMSTNSDENQRVTKNLTYVSGEDAFLLYQSYGFPIEMTIEVAKERGMVVDIEGFNKELKKHQDISKTATKGKFVAGLADQSAESTRYHTATHMLHKALKVILGPEVQQMGSNITRERLRFDFNFPRKLTNEEIKKIEDLINKEIKKNHKVTFEEVPYKKAIESGALSYFRERYPENVHVYSIGDFSREICTGPHVKNTKEMGKFKIVKEESSSSGIRRIKAILE